MNMQKLLLVCLCMMLVVTGCKGSSNPTSPSTALVDERDGEESQDTSSTVSDDTTNSDIYTSHPSEETSVIVAIGDSITYGVGSSVGGYPAILLSRLLAEGYNVTVYNEGIPGEQSAATDERFLEAIAGADIALVMIGTNDIVDPSRCPIPYQCNTIAYIEHILDYALISKTVPLVSTITPANSSSNYNWANDYIPVYNSQIYSIAAERGITVVDNYNAILYNGGNALYVDELHFNDIGYGVIAEQWYQAIAGNNLLEKP